MLWAPSVNSAPLSAEQCRKKMDTIYNLLWDSYEIGGYETDWLLKADNLLAHFKADCPTQEALSVADIENGKLLSKVRAHREKELKAATHLDEYGRALPKRNLGGLGPVGGMIR